MKTLFLIAAALLIGCDKACDVNTTGTAKFDNQTGRSLSLEVCDRGSTKVSTLAIPGDQDGVLTVSNYKSTKVVGGYNRSCNEPDRTSTVAVMLATPSFGQVKFCHKDDNGSEITIVETFQNCPTGTTAQSGPVDDCKII